MNSLEYKGGNINYSVTGKGNALVLLHGFLETKDIWSSYAKHLSSKNRVICIDLPGHGESSCYGYSHSMEFMAECVFAVLKELNVRKFHIVGHSLGGYVAMALAEKWPDNIRGLCMFHSTSDADSKSKKIERDKVIRLVQKNKEIFVRQAIPNLFNTSFKPYKRAISTISKKALQTDVQGIIAALEGMKIRRNREIVLKFAPYPVLYIIGKHDNVLPYKKLLSEVDLCENAYSVVLENTGHMGFIEDGNTCLTSLQRFLKK